MTVQVERHPPVAAPTAAHGAALEPPLRVYSLGRRLTAEALGICVLVAVVVGSGIMAERLCGGNPGLALLANAMATGAGLFVLITALGPVSGAHFNPVVSLAFAVGRELPWAMLPGYVAVQVLGGLLGVVLAHAMFALPLVQVSTHLRAGPSQAISEVAATFGLLLTLFGALRFRPAAAPAAVGLYITAAYWFTASTAFANPAVTLARTLTDSFAGIAPTSAPAFILAQLSGAGLALALIPWLLTEERADG